MFDLAKSLSTAIEITAGYVFGTIAYFGVNLSPALVSVGYI